MAFQSVKLSAIDAFPDLEISFSYQDVETVVLPNLNDAPSNIGHAIGRASQRNRYSKPRSSGRPQRTRWFTEEQVFYLNELYWIAYKSGFPLNAFLTVNLGHEDKVKLRKHITDLLADLRKRHGSIYAFWTFEKEVRDGALHTHVLIHAPEPLMVDLQKKAKRKRYLDEGKKKRVSLVKRVEDDEIISYVTKQHEPTEDDKRLLCPEKQRQWCKGIDGERWGATPELKALLAEKKKPHSCRQGPLKQRAEKPTLPIGSKLAA